MTNPTDPQGFAPALSAAPRRGRPPNIPRPQGIAPNTPAEAVRQALAPDAPLPPATQTANAPLRAEPATPVALEDPRARAARRAFELREHLGSLDKGDDEYAIDPRIIPDGWSYEWKRRTVLMADRDDGANASYMVLTQQRGWEAVPTSRHPDMMPRGHNPSAAIERKGMVLMERPLEITKEVENIERNKARAQVGQKEAQLNNAPPGTFGRDNKGAPLAQVRKEFGYEPIQVPK
jgi:hypothetical protein